MALQHLRSSTAHKRPIPTVMSAGQIAINTNEASPALFFKDSNGDLVKVGPVHIGTDAPNSSPASVAATALVTGTVYQILTVGTSDFTLVGAASNTVGTIFTATGTTTGTGTVSGQQGVEKGEMWLDTTGGTYVLKIYDGSAWRSESGTFVDSAGDTMTGALLLDNAASASAPDLSFDGDADTGVYSPGANQVAIATGGDGRVFIDSSGNVGIGVSSIGSISGRRQLVIGGSNGGLIDLSHDTTATEGRIFVNNGEFILRAAQSDGELLFQTAGTNERARIDSGGRLLIGTSTAIDTGNSRLLQIVDNNANPVIALGRNDTSVSNNNEMGSLRWYGNDSDGTFDHIATISCNADDVHSNSSKPTSLRFSTTASGAIGVTERARLDAAGRFGVGLTPSADASITDVSAGLIQTDGNIDIRYPGTNSDPNGTRYLNFINTDTTLVAGQPMGGIQWIGNDSDNPNQETASIRAFCSSNTGSGSNMTFRTGQNERMRIDSSGNVGIGTSNPGQLVQIGEGDTGVGTNVHSIARIEGRAVGGGEQVATLEFNQITNAPSEFVGASIGIESSAGTRSESELVFKVSQGTNTDATEAMRLSHDGRLGIGTTSPGSPLTIESNAGNQVKVTYPSIASYYLNATSGGDFAINKDGTERARIDSSGRLLIGLSSDVSGSADNVLQMMTVGGARLVLGRDDASISSGNTVGDIQFYGNDAGTQTRVGFVRCSAEASYTATSKPTALLFGTTASDSTDATERMRIDQDGNVGIGDANPDQLLHITGTNPTIQVESNGGVGDTARLLFRVADTGGTVRNMAQIDGLGTGSNAGALRFFARISGNLTEAARIDSSGNLGINTDSPSNLLDVASANGDGIRIGSAVAGTITRETEGLRITGASTNKVISFVTAGSEAMRVDTSGRLLVGTSSARTSWDNTTFNGNLLQVERSGDLNSCGVSITSNPGTSSPTEKGAFLYLARSRGTTDGSNTVVASGDLLGKVSYQGADGSEPVEAAKIEAFVDGTPGSNDMPGRLVFSTTADGASSPTERMRIDSVGTVGIGTASPSAALAIGSYNGTKGIALQTGTTDSGYIYFADGSSGDSLYRGYIQYDHPVDALRIGTAATEQMRIDSSGNVLAGKSTTSLATVGHALLKASYASHTVSGNPCLRVNRLASDGALVQFYQAGSLEGSISVSGSTVSYNGAHLSRWSQLANGAERFEILRGSVLSNLDEMCEWSEESNEQLNRMKVSDVEGDRNVSGVFQAWDDDDDTYTNDFYCAMTGDFVIRIAQGVTVERGDLLMSAGDGTAKPQDDDIIRSKTIAKVTSNQVSETYADGSYCVPCVLMAC